MFSFKNTLYTLLFLPPRRKIDTFVFTAPFIRTTSHQNPESITGTLSALYIGFPKWQELHFPGGKLGLCPPAEEGITPQPTEECWKGTYVFWQKEGLLKRSKEGEPSVRMIQLLKFRWFLAYDLEMFVSISLIAGRRKHILPRSGVIQGGLASALWLVRLNPDPYVAFAFDPFQLCHFKFKFVSLRSLH